MNAPAISEKQVHGWLEELFEDDLHAKRVLSLSLATLGVIRAASLSVHAIGRALATARGTSGRHGVKQVDRLLSNEGIKAWDLAASWVPFVLAERVEAVVALDWTDYDQDDQCTLVASLVTSHGRPTPLLWVTTEKSLLKGQRNELEDSLLLRLKEVIPQGVKVTILADRGFADHELYALLAEVGFDFVIRFQERTQVRDSSGTAKRAGFWVPPNGRTLKLEGVTITEKELAIPVFVCTKKPKMKEAWCLASSLAQQSGAEVVKLYGRRFTIEEGFRDVKDLRFGMGLKAMRVGTPERRDRLLLIGALAIALLTLLGAAGEAAGIDRHYKTNTSPKRQLSLFRQGCLYYECIPAMRDAWLKPLMQKFGELVEQHATFRAAFGLI